MEYIYKIFAKKGDTFIVKLYKKLFLRSSQKVLKWLRLCGAKIGEGTEIVCGAESFLEPFMVTIGDNVYIAGGVNFITHDGALSWMSRKMGLTDKRREKIGKIKIGNNCFIGYGSTIMMNVEIGNNCIVASKATVTKNVPDNSVVGGCPARVICSVEDYLERNKERNDYTCGWAYADKRKYYEDKGMTK